MLFVPLVVAPYLTRTLGSNNLGIYAYVHSISYYFVLFAMLGISKYGQRLIAQTEFGSCEQRKSFWSLYATHVFFSIIAIVLYTIFIFTVVKDNTKIFWFEIFYVISALFDVTWLFYGLENFKSVVYRNIIVKVLECILIFTFVKSNNDFSLYVIICSMSILIGQVAMIPMVLKLVKPIRFSLQDCKVHIRPLFLFTIAVLAVSLYTIFDKTLLGLFSTKSDVAFYEYSDRLIKIPLTFIAVLGTVMLPRSCQLVKKNDRVDIDSYYISSIWFTAIVSAISFWLFLVLADDLAVGYLGPEFKPCGTIIKLLSPLILIVGMGDIVRSQYLIPHGRDKQYVLGISISAAINILVSITLLYYLPINLKFLGVIVGTIFAETFGTLYQFYVCRDIVSVKCMIFPIIASSLLGMLTAFALLLLAPIFPVTLLYTLIKAVVGLLIYLLLLMIYARLWNRELWTMLCSIINK